MNKDPDGCEKRPGCGIHPLVFAASQNAENNIVVVTLKLLHAWKDGK